MSCMKKIRLTNFTEHIRNDNDFNSNPHVPTMVDLFSGAGGTGIGFQSAGFRILGAVEINSHAIKTYEHNLKVKVTPTDIREIIPSKFREEMKIERKELDVLVGCPPCQGFSRIRKGKGGDDERNDLVLSYLKFVKEFMPRHTIFENVLGILRYDYARVFYEKLQVGLKRLGYTINTFEEDAADYGTPQHRRRVVVVGARKGEPMLELKKTHGNPNSKEVKEGRLLPWKTVRQAIGKYPKLAAGQNGEKNGSFPNHIAPAIISQRVLNFIRDVPHNGGSRTDVPREKWLACHLSSEGGFTDVYGRLSWDKPSNTLTCGCTNLSKGRYIHPEQDRGITYREAAALQGFEDTFIFQGSDIGRQIGNSVSPQLSVALATVIKERIFALENRDKTNKSDATDIACSSEPLEHKLNGRNPKDVPVSDRSQSAKVTVVNSTIPANPLSDASSAVRLGVPGNEVY